MDKGGGVEMKNKKKQNYIINNPNTPEDTADCLFKLFIEANLPKAEAAIQNAANTSTNRTCLNQRDQK